MERRDFLRASGLLGLAVGVPGASRAALGQSAAAPSASAAPGATPGLALRGAPVVGHTSSDQSTILWAADGPATSWLEYGETPQLGQRADNDEGGLRPYGSPIHRVTVRGLKPGKRYYYRAHTRAIDFRNAYSIQPGATLVSEVGSFTTLDPQAASTRFVVWNDTHDNRQTLTALHEMTSRTPHDFLLHNGDVSNDIGSEEQLVGLFVDPYGLPFAQNAPLLFARGNHDVRGRAARLLPEFVAVPENRFFYSFRQGPLAALVMDTGEDKPDSHPVYGGLNNFAAYRSAQRTWLEREIQKPAFRSAPFRVLFCHIPLWWRDEQEDGEYNRDSRTKWHDLLVKAKIHAVVSGHTHQTLVLPPSAARPYHQIVGGGPKPEAATLIEGRATQRELFFTVKNLTGKVLSAVPLRA